MTAQGFFLEALLYVLKYMGALTPARRAATGSIVIIAVLLVTTTAGLVLGLVPQLQLSSNDKVISILAVFVQGCIILQAQVQRLNDQISLAEANVPNATAVADARNQAAHLLQLVGPIEPPAQQE